MEEVSITNSNNFMLLRIVVEKRAIGSSESEKQDFDLRMKLLDNKTTRLDAVLFIVLSCLYYLCSRRNPNELQLE